MFRNRSKVSRRRNFQNVQTRNSNGSQEHSSSASGEIASSSKWDRDYDESGDSSDEESSSPVIKGLNAKRKLTVRSKRTPINRNRNKSNVRKRTNSDRDSEAAGPSHQNLRKTRSVESNTRSNKRKFKDGKNQPKETDNDSYSSSDTFDNLFVQSKTKRMRQVNPICSSDSEDDSTVRNVQPLFMRRQDASEIESSTSSEIIGYSRRGRISPDSESSNSDIFRFTEGVRRRNQSFGVRSDSSSDFMEDSSTRESGSPIIGVTRRAQAVHLLRSMNLSSSPTTNSNSSFSFESELLNSASIPDSESSSYNTAQSSNCNKDQSTDSDSSDTDGEKCAICLKKFKNQLIGNPSNCDHNFCAPCLKKWSESSTTCPVDRSTFDAIVIRSEINGAIIDRVKVENRNFGIFPPLDIDEVLLNESINCEICASGDDEETLLLCDFCNLGYHMACLIPPLQAIPAGSWYCPPCMDLHSNPTENMNEAIRLLGDIPMRSYFLLPPVMRPRRLRSMSPNRVRPRTGRSRPSGPLPRGRGPTTTRGIHSQNSSSSSGLQDFSNVIESVAARLNAAFSAESRRKRRRKRARRSGSARVRQANASDSAEVVDSAINRIIRKVNHRSSAVPQPITRPRGSNDVVELVFPSFSIFGSEEFDYYSDGGNDLEGEVAIMARVRSEYSARRVQSRKNIASSLSGQTNPMVECEETSSSVNLLDSILESQSLWHSRNVEIKSKKDGTLEIKKKNGENKPDLTNTNHSSKEIPLYPNKNENSSENKSYTNNNARYSSLGGSNNGGGNTFSPSTSSFNSLSPSTRPGFSNLLGNSSTAMDLSPFRGAAPIRFRMNPPRPAMKRPMYSSNSQRQSSMSTSVTNSMQSPKKSSNDDDVDLYDDIDTENMESEKSQEMFASLEPPPEPPALLIGSDSSSDDENNGLVIDDKALNTVNKSNMYDPTDPNEDSDDGNDKNSLIPSYLKSPSYGGLSEFGPHLPLPEPPALPIELDSVKDSDEDEEAECPNMTLYSSTSINLANNVQDIPIPDAAYPIVTHDDLDFIPVPTSGSQDASDKTETCDENVYSPTNSETSSVGCMRVYPKNLTSADEEASSDDNSEKREKRGSKRKSRADSLGVKNAEKMSKNEDTDDEKDKEIDLTEIDDSNDSKGEKSGTEDESEGFSDEVSIKDVDDDRDEEPNVDTIVDKAEFEVDDNRRLAEGRSESEEEEEEEEKSNEKDEENVSITEVEEKESSEKDESLVAVTEVEDAAQDDEGGKANSADVTVSNYLLPSEDLDPVSDVEYNDFPDYQRSSTSKDKRKKRKRVRKRNSSSDNKIESKELEEGEIEDEKSRRKYASQRRKTRSESPEHSVERKPKRKRDRKEKSAGKENKGSYAKSGEDFTWKKLSKNTKERNYRDGKAKPGDKLAERNKEREAKNKKEKRKEIERYDVRKIVSDKPRPVRDEFGRDVSANRSRSRTRSRSGSYSGRRRSKGGTTTFRRSLSQEDRWIDWSPVWTQRRSRSRTRRSKSRSRNRSRLSSDRYRNRSKNRDRERDYDKREIRKRRRSISSEIEKYSPPPPEMKKRRRSRDRSRKSESYGPLRPGREIPDYYYERSWSRSITYASLTPEPDPYVRYSRSPSILEAPTRIPLLSPDRDRDRDRDHDHDLLTPNPQNLTVIVPNVDINKKKHKKKKDGKKKKKKQPSKEVFTSGDNIVVSVNFDDNQKIISAKSSKRKHTADEEKTRKKKKDDTRRKRKQTLQVSEEVLNAKPVAVIDLNSSPCKEMSPTEVISLTDSGDENNANENANPTDRRISQEYAENYQPNEDKSKSPERRAYVMTQSGPKTPPEPPIKFTVNSTVQMRTLPTNPVFEQDEIDQEVDVRYNKGPDTPSEATNQTRRSISPNTTMYDPFEPTKSRSQSPENAELYEERKEQPTPEERRPVLDMFADDNDKPSDSQNSEKAEPPEESKENTTPNVPAAVDEPQTNTAFGKTSPTKETASAEPPNETNQSNGVNKLVLDLSSLGDDFVPKSSIPLVKTSQGKYEFQSGKAPDKPITVVISQQSQPAKPQPQQVMVTPTRQVLTKPVEPIKQPVFPDILPWKLPPPVSQPTFSTPPASSAPPGSLVTPSKSAPNVLTQNGNQDESAFEVDDSPYSPASSEGDDLFEPPPLNSTSSPNKQKPLPMPAVNSYKSRVDALFSSSPIKKLPPRTSHGSKPVSAIKGTKKIVKSNVVAGSKKEVGIKADEEQLKILDDVPNSAVEMIVKEKFLKKLHRQERVVEEVKVVLKPHYAKKHINKEEYKDILRKAVPKICHNKSGDINPSKIQSLVEAYVKKIRHSKKKPPAMFPPMQSSTKIKKPKTLWG